MQVVFLEGRSMAPKQERPRWADAYTGVALRCTLIVRPQLGPMNALDASVNANVLAIFNLRDRRPQYSLSLMQCRVSLWQSDVEGRGSRQPSLPPPGSMHWPLHPMLCIVTLPIWTPPSLRCPLPPSPATLPQKVIASATARNLGSEVCLHA